MTEYGHNPGPLPQRWLRCPRKASDLVENLFLAFKTPLDERFNDQVPVQYRFTPDLLFESVKSNRQKLGLWVDLTRTNRFYDKERIEANECKYIKLECHGHAGAPSIEQTKTFVSICKLFFSKQPLSLIGVHCTHGFNRTGFMIIAYLIECYDYSIEVAIRYFARVRPPGIYKEEYIKELYRRYDDVQYAPPAPPRPEWCYEETTNDNCARNTKTNGRKKRNSYFKENPTFMEGVSGVEAIIDCDEANAIRRKVKTLTGSSLDGFVGSQPVSMDRNNIHLLADKSYRVSWKADGTRYMMFIDGNDEVYFLDRDNSVFKIHNLQFFLRKANNAQHLTNTLLDGEMVIDKFNNMDIPRYLVYDIVIFEGNNIGQQPFFPTRLRAIEKEIIEPRVEAMKEGRIIREGEPFSVRAKRFFELFYASQLLGEKFAKQLTHAPDGLIFQPSDDPYRYGTSPNVLKWKPESMNSIDFKLRVNLVKNIGCLPEYIGDLLTSSGQVFGKIKCDKKLRELHDKIVECKLEGKRWVFMRERTDKSFANSDQTAMSVYESIRSPVTQTMLLEFIENHGWKDPMPPPMAPPPVKRSRTN